MTSEPIDRPPADSPTANSPTARVGQFKAEIADMKLKTGRSRVEDALQVLGVILMIAGIAVAFGAYAASLNVKATPGADVDLLNSGSYLPLAVGGLAMSVTGGFLFLRYSLARFLRFWLLRQTYEQRIAIDEVSRSRTAEE